jgi:hypothetical protein
MTMSALRITASALHRVEVHAETVVAEARCGTRHAESM